MVAEKREQFMVREEVVEIEDAEEAEVEVARA